MRPPASHEAARRPWVGLLEAVAAATLWGSSGIFSVLLFREGVPPRTLALLRPLVGGAALGLWLFLFRRGAARVGLPGLVVLVGAGGAVMASFQLSYQLSMDAVGVPATVALLYLAPAMVVAASGPLLGEWPTARRVGLAAVVVAGVWLSVVGARAVPTSFGSTGVAWGILAAASYGGYTLFGRFAAPRWGSLATVTWTTLGSCLLLAVAVPAATGPLVLPATSGAWTLLVLYGLLTVAVAQFLFFDALRRLEASRVSIASTIEPVVAALLATTLLDQGLAPVGWVGLGVVVAGVVGVAWSRPPGRRAEEQPDG